jgi:hypothetical protein
MAGTTGGLSRDTRVVNGRTGRVVRSVMCGAPLHVFAPSWTLMVCGCKSPSNADTNGKGNMCTGSCCWGTEGYSTENLTSQVVAHLQTCVNPWAMFKGGER